MTDATLPARPGRRTVLFGGAALLAAGGAALALRSRLDRFDGAEMSPSEALLAARAGKILLLDIRRPDEWEATGIPEGGVPLDIRREDFAEAVAELTGGRFDAPVALICARGVRSDRASARLSDAGFTQVIDVPEGMLGSAAGPGWIERGLPVVRP